jgi:tetratricopeptide (TPR) repeat protein
MWLIKTYIQTEEYPKAIATIEQLLARSAGVSKPPKELQRNMDFTIADYYIAVKDYNKASTYLKSGILLNKDRDLRTRAMFILGQIYMHQGDATRATAQFKKVIKRNPEYEMVFESKMNMAKMGNANNAAELYKMMNKMLRDSKNEDYYDRIYYAMAELALREGDEAKAIDYLRKSVAAFKNNEIQRMMSSLKVASIFFENNEYDLAQAYYDTAVTSMDKKYEGYDSIMNISQTLNELVMYASTVHDQDSLLRVASMDSISRNKLIDKIIAQVMEKERLEREFQQYEEQLALMGSTTTQSRFDEKPQGPNSGATWYFYNQSTVSKGITEFTRKWGMRKNEDNWFISDKRSLANAFADNSDDEITTTSQAGSDSLTPSYTNHDRGYYLQDLPLTDEAKAVADSLIADGLYHLGFLYMDRLSNLPRSIEAYEQLDKRYPGNIMELPTWYALYKMYKDLGNEEQSLVYKGKIFDKYPTSSYAEFINDPNYFEKMQAQEREASDFYSKTYDAFEQGQYYRVKMNTERAMELYSSDTAFMPRFAFLHAVAQGRLVSIDTMAYALYDLVRTYPNSGITSYARRVLEEVNEEYHLGMVLENLEKSEGGKEPEIKKASPYVYEPNIQHFVMMVCNSKLVRVEPLKVRISDFNKKEHRTKSYNISTVILDESHTIVTIGNFDNEKTATDYITSMFLTDYVFGGIDKTSYTITPISVKNYPVYYQSKDLDEYIQFIESNKK